MILYTMDRTLERRHAQDKGITLFYDLKDVTSKNLHIGIPKCLVSAIVGHFPIRIESAYILNAPFAFRGMFGVISLMMPAKLRKRFHFVSSVEEVYDAIDKEMLLEEHGGARAHDAAAWVASQVEREESGSMCSLKECFVAQEK